MVRRRALLVNGLYGRAATGLTGDTSWAVSAGAASAGAKAEQATEKILSEFITKAAVMHDLRVPIPNFKANIDHVIVTGKTVIILDTKNWQPGFYWTFRGVNRRGFTKVPHTGKDQSYITKSVETYLAGTGAKVKQPVLIVWPSRRNEKISLWMLRTPGASLIEATGLTRLVGRQLRKAPADGIIVNLLSKLLLTP